VADKTLTPTLWFVGLTTLDVIHRGVAPQHRNQKVTATWQQVCAGGPAANAAVVAATLGATAILITALGENQPAKIAREDLARHSVQVIDVADQDFQFAVSAILVDEKTSERSVVSLDGGKWKPQHNFADALASVLEKWGVPRAVMFDGHHPVLARQVAKLIATQPERSLVILDGGRWREIFSELIPIADVAALSHDFTVPNQEAPVAEAVLEMGANAVVITNGSAPVEWICNPKENSKSVEYLRSGGIERRTELDEVTTCDQGKIPVPQVTALDTLGAGDAFHGALTYWLANGDELSAAITKANQVAATKVQHLGNRDWLEKI